MLTGAHEFAHALQVGAEWRVSTIARNLSVALLLSGLIVAAVDPFTWVVPLLATSLIVWHLAFQVPTEAWAISQSYSLSLQYVDATEGVDDAVRNGLEEFARHRVEKTMHWYMLTLVKVACEQSVTVLSFALASVLLRFLLSLL